MPKTHSALLSRKPLWLNCAWMTTELSRFHLGNLSCIPSHYFTPFYHFNFLNTQELQQKSCNLLWISTIRTQRFFWGICLHVFSVNNKNDSWTVILERMSTMSTTAKMFIGSSFLHLSLYWYCLSITNGETEHIVDFNPEATDAHSVAAYGVLIVGADC